MNTMVLAVVAAVCAVLDVVLGFFAWRYQRRVSGLTRPVNVKHGKRNSIMLLGLGGVGKTTFIRSLFGGEKDDPTDVTEYYELHRTTFSMENPSDPRKARKYTLFVGDYRGQNLGQLVREFITQQKNSFDPMAYGFINSLILIVDLFPPPEDRDDQPLLPQEKLNEDRIQLHEDQWNETALDAVFGLLTRGSLKYVCLYVNKSDLYLGSKNKHDVIREKFKDLAPRLKKRADSVGAIFQLIIGSASEGGGIPEVKRILFDTSVPGKS